MRFLFIETPLFTREVLDLLPDEVYRALPSALLFRPEQGAAIPGCGGLRKLRWGGTGRGKRGGLRLIYYWDHEHDAIYLLRIYAKNVQEDLTPGQIRVLKRLVREEFR